MEDEREAAGELLRANRNRVLTSPLTSLQDLACLNTDLDYFLAHKDEFDKIPNIMVDHLLSLPGCQLRLPEYYPLTVRAGRHSILIPCYFEPDEEPQWNSQQLNSTLDLVLQNCPPGSVEKFGFCYAPRPRLPNCQDTTHAWCYDDVDDYDDPPFPQPDLERVHAILRQQPELVEIRIDQLDLITPETLSIITGTCHSLRSLALGMMSRDGLPLKRSPREEMSDAVIQRIIERIMERRFDVEDIKQLAEGCPLLEELRCREELSSEGTLYGLEHFKKLKYISSKITPSEIAEFSRSGGVLPPSWQPDLSFPTRDLNSRDLNDLTTMQSLCPNLESLVLYNLTGITEIHFKSVKKLKILKLQPADIPKLDTFLRSCGAHVVELKLHGSSSSDYPPLDLSVITERCPVLRKLLIDDLPISLTCQYPVTPGKVKSLRCLTVMNAPENTGMLPDDFLYPIAHNGVLEHLEVPSISPGLLATLSQDMRDAAEDSKPSPVFPWLTHLFVEKVGLQPMTRDQAMELVVLAPRLKFANLKSLPESDKEEIGSFLEEFSPDFTHFYSELDDYSTDDSDSSTDDSD